MEPHMNHGQPGWLGAWLQDRCHQGLGVPEAECLCLRMYYKFDGIPMALRHQLSRGTLASTFAELARLGWIRTTKSTAAEDLLTPKHWQRLLTPNYQLGGPIYDHALGETVFHRLRLGPG